MNMDLDAATQEAPTLTLDPFAEAKAEIVEKKPEELVEEQAVPEMELTPEEQKMVDDFAADRSDQYPGSIAIRCGKPEENCGFLRDGT